VDTVKLTANGNVLWDPAPTSGNTQECPAAAGAVAYLLEAVGPGGTGRGQQNISVVEPEEPITPEPVPGDPVIYSFNVSPNQIRAGDCVNIAWGVGGGTTYVRIMLNGNEVWRSEEFQGQQSQCLDQPGDYTYELLAGNVAKEVSSGPRTVSVSSAPSPNPLANTHWVVTSIQDGAVPIVPDAPPTISFYDGGGLDGAGACMTYGGSYHAEGDSISISVEGSSALNCSEFPDVEARMAQDAAFLDRLPMATYFSVEGERLLILDPGGQRLMELSLMLW
jgi:heat shock protein HslJ